MGDKVAMRGWGAAPAVCRAAVIAAAVLAAAPAVAWQTDGRLGRWSVGGYAEGYGVIPVDPGSPTQRPEGILDVNVTGDVARRARFFLDLRTTAGGTPEHTDGIGVVDLGDTFQNITPAIEFEEGWMDLYLPSVDVRIGKQKFAWGKLDTFQPTDVVNPRRDNDPFVLEEQDAKIGVPAVRASYYPPPLPPRFPTDTNLTLIWVPVPVPPRFPLADERWFPPTIRVSPVVTVPGSLIARGAPDIAVRTGLRTENAPPPQQLDEGAVGLRLSGLSGPADWALYYYDGPETARAFSLSTTVVAPSPGDFARCLGGLRPGTACRLAADTVLRPIAGRIRMAGADAAIALGGVTARVEGAWFADRLLPRIASDLITSQNILRAAGGKAGLVHKVGLLAGGRRVPIDLGDLFVARDTVEWGAGLDYRVRGWMPVLQVNQTLVLDNRTVLLVNDVDTRLFLVVRKNFLADRLATETGIIEGLERGYTAGITRVTYAITDAWRIRAGYVLIAGTRRSVIGQYHDDDEAFLQLRYAY